MSPMHRRLFLGAPLFFALLSIANAATLTLPSFTVPAGPVSTGITCSPISNTLSTPVAPGTVLTSCTVAPASWIGAVSLSTGPQFGVANLNGNTFNVIVGPIALAAGTYNPGTLQSVP